MTVSRQRVPPVLLQGPRRNVRATQEREAFVNARTCYRHLAGKVAVAFLGALRSARLVRASGESFELTKAGAARCAELGLECARWPVGKACLDVTERVPHLGGPLGSRLTQEMFRLGWLARDGEGRAVRTTARGRKALASLGISLPQRV